MPIYMIARIIENHLTFFGNLHNHLTCVKYANSTFMVRTTKCCAQFIIIMVKGIQL